MFLINQTRDAMYYNVTLRRIGESIFAVKKQLVLQISVCVCVRARAGGSVCVCVRAGAFSFAYPACNAHAPCSIVICVLSDSTKFFDVSS